MQNSNDKETIKQFINDGEEILASKSVAIDLVKLEEKYILKYVKYYIIFFISLFGVAILILVPNSYFISELNLPFELPYLNLYSFPILFLCMIVPLIMLASGAVLPIPSYLFYLLLLFNTLFVLGFVTICYALIASAIYYIKVIKSKEDKFWLTTKRFIKKRGVKFEIIKLNEISMIKDVVGKLENPRPNSFYIVGRKKRVIIPVKYVENSQDLRSLIKKSLTII